MTVGTQWLSRPEGRRDVPPNGFRLPLSTSITVTPSASGLIFGDDKWLSAEDGRSPVCLRGFGPLPDIERRPRC